MLKVACSGPGVSQTRNLSVTSPILYHYTTAPTSRQTTLRYLIALEPSVVLVVGVDELSVAQLTSVLPLSVVVAAGGRVRVRPGTVSTSITPLAVIDVAVHVRELTAAVSLVIAPVTCTSITAYRCNEQCKSRRARPVTCTSITAYRGDK